jgi:hypothetical protein
MNKIKFWCLPHRKHAKSPLQRPVTVFTEMIADKTENQAKHKDMIFGQTENVYVGGAYSYHCSLG